MVTRNTVRTSEGKQPDLKTNFFTAVDVSKSLKQTKYRTHIHHIMEQLNYIKCVVT